MEKGRFVVVDGIDGVGKGVFLNTLVEEAVKEGKRVFDVHQFWKTHDFHPDSKDIISNYDIIITSEPTFVGAGRLIREELIAKNGRDYTPEATAEAYALDRRILYETLLLPILAAGIDVYQSRSFSTSIVYQRQMALDLGRDFKVEDILSIPGNAFCYAHPMDFMIVPTIKDAAEAIRRAEGREKQDNCKFENLDFQLKIKKHYESEEFRRVFERIGVPVVYMDAGKSLEFSQQQARDFYQAHLR
ncbi:MAG: hypothetical protein V2A62_03330, partial [Candidatus Woesearchaeota archaeon]